MAQVAGLTQQSKKEQYDEAIAALGGLKAFVDKWKTAGGKRAWSSSDKSEIRRLWLNVCHIDLCSSTVDVIELTIEQHGESTIFSMTKDCPSDLLDVLDDQIGKLTSSARNEERQMRVAKAREVWSFKSLAKVGGEPEETSSEEILPLPPAPHRGDAWQRARILDARHKGRQIAGAFGTNFRTSDINFFGTADQSAAPVDARQWSQAHADGSFAVDRELGQEEDAKEGAAEAAGVPAIIRPIAPCGSGALPKSNSVPGRGYDATKYQVAVPPALRSDGDSVRTPGTIPGNVGGPDRAISLPDDDDREWKSTGSDDLDSYSSDSAVRVSGPYRPPVPSFGSENSSSSERVPASRGEKFSRSSSGSYNSKPFGERVWDCQPGEFGVVVKEECLVKTCGA